MPRTRTAVTAVAGAAALLVCAAPAVADPPQPPHHFSVFVPGGADGRPHEALCPAAQHAYSGGYTISAKQDAVLGTDRTDVTEDRMNDHATGWIITVRKAQTWPFLKRSAPADLTIHIACSDDVMSHGAA
ncbi:hypothetical protein [Streptomyces herbicida]|uniref:hypothetical protein n=1 Tax=Streptomyces herbicida TaxID=3065675 RepID=UPI00292F7BEE|nr:hypothetical protein [Streptomyces sp. NEAU-HV9]